MKYNLKDLRKLSGLKAKHIAADLNISRTHLYSLEKGIYNLTLFKISKLSGLYNITEEEVISAWNNAKK